MKDSTLNIIMIVGSIFFALYITNNNNEPSNVTTHSSGKITETERKEIKTDIVKIQIESTNLLTDSIKIDDDSEELIQSENQGILSGNIPESIDESYDLSNKSLYSEPNIHETIKAKLRQDSINAKKLDAYFDELAEKRVRELYNYPSYNQYPIFSFENDTKVNSYFRSNGTRVESYHRTLPNNTIIDNYSTYPNINPHTGRTGTIRP